MLGGFYERPTDILPHQYRLQMASEAYHRSLSKKKQYEFVDKSEKLVSLDALGVVMIADGEKFGENSTFGARILLLVSCDISSFSNSDRFISRQVWTSSL